jgi:hypothetical protein
VHTKVRVKLTSVGPSALVECLHNEYLPRGVRTLNAVIVVTASGTAPQGLKQTALRVWTPGHASVTTLKQMKPPLDLTETRVVVNNLTGEYATGSWRDEWRHFLLTVRFSQEVRDRTLAARVTFLVKGQPFDECRVITTPEPDNPEGGSGVREPRMPHPTQGSAVISEPWTTDGS